MRGAGLKVRLVDRPFAQPLGYRSAAEVWNRQLRWARLRRASFLIYFLPEAFSGGVLPMLGSPSWRCVRYAADALRRGALPRSGMVPKWLLAIAAGWHVSPRYPLYGLIRDLLLPALFINALRGSDFVWRGNEMQVERIQAQRRRIIARVRPRVQQFAAGSRRRLRALRERVS